MNLDTPVGINARLQEIATDLAEREQKVQSATRQYFKAKNDYELGVTFARLALLDEKLTVQEKADRAIRAVEEKDKLHSKYLAAEGHVEAHKAAFKVIDAERSTLQTMMKMGEQ